MPVSVRKGREDMDEPQNMDNEMFRFATFECFPRKGKPYVTRLAQAGLYHTSQGDEAKCYCCKNVFSDWSDNDDPLDVHRNYAPTCSFFTNNKEVNIVVTVAPNDDLFIDMSESPESLASFERGNNNHREDRHISGVFGCPNLFEANLDHHHFIESKTGTMTNVKTQNGPCTVNGACYSFWNNAENCTSMQAAFQSTLRTTPNGTVEENDVLNASSDVVNATPHLPSYPSRSSDNLNRRIGRSPKERIPSQHSVIPKHPRYATIESRIKSFDTCEFIAVSKECLSIAGFFYAGLGDCTRCYFCGIGLRHWDDGDDPWTEHARFSIDCYFVYQMKGSDFIHQIRLSIGISDQQTDDEDCTGIGSMAASASQKAENIVSHLLMSDVCAPVREMGFTDERITEAIRAVLRDNGRSAVTAVAILEQMLTVENYQTPDNVNSQTQAIPLNSLQQEESSSQDTATNNTPKSENILENNTSKQTQESSKQGQQTQTPSSQTQDAYLPPDASAINKEAQPIEEGNKSHKRLVQENKILKAITYCSDCKTEEVCIVFLPCGHLTTCEKCAPKQKMCSMCHQIIKGTVKTYRS